MRIVPLFFTLVLASFSYSQQGLPIKINNEKIKPLSKMVDSSLQSRLETEIMNNSEWADLIASKKMAVGVVDLSNPEKVRFARINGNYMMYAASLPKIALLHLRI